MNYESLQHYPVLILNVLTIEYFCVIIIQAYNSSIIGQMRFGKSNALR